MVGVAIGGAAVLGAGASVVAGNKAAKASKNAAETASNTEKYIYDQTREDYAPYREIGYDALGTLGNLYGLNGQEAQTAAYEDFQTSPGYQFRLDEATKAIERSAAAAGKLRSGGTMKAIGRYVGNAVAGPEYDVYANRLAALAGVGQTATGSTAQAGANYASGVSQAAYAAGNAQAGQAINTGNAINSGVTNLASAYLYNQGYGGGGTTVPAYGYA